MRIRTSPAPRVLVVLLLLVALSMVIAACDSGDTDPSTTAVSDSSSTTATSDSVTTTTLPDALSGTQTLLKRSYRAQFALANYLTEVGAADDDPRLGLFYGLKARTQALSCMDSIDQYSVESDAAKKQGFKEAADVAMRDVYEALNQGEALGSESVTQILVDARTVVATLGAPSDDFEEALTAPQPVRHQAGSSVGRGQGRVQCGDRRGHGLRRRVFRPGRDTR